MADLLSGIPLSQLALVWAVVVFAAVMRAFTGFGFALTAVPAFSLIMAPTDAVVLSASLTLAVSLLTLNTYWGRFPLRPMLPMLAAALLGSFAGAALLSAISPRQFQLWIGLAVIAASLALSVYRPGRQPPGSWLGGATGAVSGLLNGAFAIPGPPVIIYAMATEPEPARSRALLMTFFLFAAVMALLSYAAAGFVSARSPLQFLLAFPAMYLGDKLGYHLFHRFGGALYRRVAVSVLFAVGLVMTGRALMLG
nr:sulfite exporter TauE/SafE family protein [Parahaliea mediterranea]